MTDRRRFLAAGAAFVTALPVFAKRAAAAPADAERAQAYRDPGVRLVRDGVAFAREQRRDNIRPVLREEILDNPGAVFLVRTNLSMEKDAEGQFPPGNAEFQDAGYEIARRIFRRGDRTGGATYIKPNFVGGFGGDPRSVNNGVSTHPWFVAGFCDALREIGNTGVVVGANGAATHQNFVESGICELLDDHGVCFTEGKYASYADYTKDELTWIDYPDGIVMRRVPFFRLAADPDTLLIDMAKDRIHQLGFTTLTIKNLQGIMPVGYMHICSGWPTTLNRGSEKNVFNPDYRRAVERLYIRHARENYKFWDDGGCSRDYFANGGWEAYRAGEFQPDYKVFWGEQWGQRMMDVNCAITPHVNLVEGIVGVDGANTLHLNNFIAVSRSRTACDSVASWLMGHDPRELPYLRIAAERGLGTNDIDRIPIYELTARDVVSIPDYRTLPRAAMGVWVYSTKGRPLKFF